MFRVFWKWWKKAGTQRVQGARRKTGRKTKKRRRRRRRKNKKNKVRRNKPDGDSSSDRPIKIRHHGHFPEMNDETYMSNRELILDTLQKLKSYTVMDVTQDASS